MPTKTKPTGGRGQLRRPRTHVNKQEEVTAATLLHLSACARACARIPKPQEAWEFFATSLRAAGLDIRAKHGGNPRPVMFATPALKREFAKDAKTVTKRLTKAGVRFRG